MIWYLIASPECNFNSTGIFNILSLLSD